MKKSRILTIIALVLVAMLSFTACDAIKDLINPPTPDVQSHACESVCAECGYCLDADCTDAACATKCQGHKTPDEDPVDPAHKCEHVCETCGLCLDADCTDAACASKCEGHEVAPTHKCESVCEECGKCTDADCSESVCAEKCEGHVVATTPVISVAPAELEINAGDDIDLMFGVTVSDEGDPDVKVIIQDSQDFNSNVQGTYVITYAAKNKFGNIATATRTVIVNKALSALSLEVQKNLLGENKWQGTIISFKNAEYVVLNASATLDKQSGVFYNASSSEIKLTVSNSGYAVVGVITANGVVIEGRDGANNKLVNAANPTRGSSTAAVGDINKVADDIIIPAGGYAIVVQSGYAGSGVDADGRGFMNYNVIGTYGNVVRLVWADTSEVLTPYVDQAPVITGHGTTVYANGGDFDLNTEVLKGVVANDDNGTFDPNDNVTLDVTVKDIGGFDITKEGKYTITLEVTDGTHTTTVTRIVEVNANSVVITVNGNSYSTLDSLVAIDKDLSVLGGYLFIVYTPDYNGKLNWSNGWGEAFVLNQYGEVVRIYDGANGKYYDLENAGGINDASKCTAAGYLTEAFNSRQAGEYLLVAPNGNGNVSRSFLLSNRVIGAKVVIPGITFAHKCESVCVQCGLCLNAECTNSACANKCQGHVHNCEDICEVCAKCTSECDNEVCAAKCDCVTVVVNGKSLKVLGGTIAIDVAAPSLGSYNFVVYTYAFKAQNPELTWNNGWSQAFIINEYGQVVRIYDGVSGGKYFDANNLAGIVDSTFTTAGNTLKDAYASLSEGEVLILGANGGMNGNAGRSFLGGVRVVGAIAVIPGVTFKALPEHACESACAECGKCMDATCIFPACLSKCVCHRCESICSKCNGCLDPACTEKACETKCSCHDCESLCAICGGCKDTECTNEVCAKKCVCSDTSANKYFAINGTSFMAAEGKWLYNTQCGNTTEPKAQNYKMIIFDKNYNGTFSTNSYGVAVVVDGNGKLVKGYAWDGYYTADGKVAIHYAVGDYATTAFAELKAGEVLIIFPNDGANAADSARTFGKGLCDNWATTMGKDVVLTGYTFSVPAHECESVCPACGKCLDAACAETVCADKCQGHSHICESTCATCSKCLDKECTDEACVAKCNCVTFSVNGKTFTAAEGKWLYNTAVSSSNAANYAMIIYDKNYTGSFTTNSYGAAIVLDKYGKLTKIYDGANGWFYALDNVATGRVSASSVGFTTANYATVAFSNLADGETLIIFPNDGGSNAARGFALGLRNIDGTGAYKLENGEHPYFGKVVSITGFEFLPLSMTFSVNGKSFTAEEGKWLYNTAVSASNAANYAMIIYDKNYTGSVSINGYGAAIVVDKDGKLTKIYDGANGWFYALDNVATGRVSASSVGFTTANYATVAFSNLADGETLIIFPNDGGSNAARGFALGLRNIDGTGAYKLENGEHPYFGKVVSMTGFTFN